MSSSSMLRSLVQVWRPSELAAWASLLAAFSLLLWLGLAHPGRRSGTAERKMKLPPGPVRWPLVGCLPAVGFKHRHRTFFNLSKKYGPVMQVPIGTAKLIVVHGADLARELLKTRDSHFCSRPLSMTGTYLGFDHADVNLTPFNSNWQATRKALSLFLFSPSKIASQAPMRRELICASVTSLFHQADAVVNLSAFADNLMARITVRMLFGDRYNLDDKQACRGQNSAAVAISKALQDLEPDLREGICLWGELNLADFFPILSWWDFQGLERRFRLLRNKLERLFALIIQEHRDSLSVNGYEKDEDDFLSVLLAQKQLSDKQLMGILSNVLIAGTDTTAKVIEWGMAELAANPGVMRKAQEELDRVVGKERLMNETDIDELPYLQSVLKEVLRLHPSAPMDDPHLNESPSTLGGYHIPQNSIVLHNLWALGQDDSIWDDPAHFEPDRFLKDPAHQAMNVYGSHFQLLPFSSGRRRCPAYQVATLTLQHVLGVLLHAYEWSLPSSGILNMEEGDGIVVGLKHPLILRFVPRLPSSAFA